jgi:prophage regulatory protein
MKSHFPEPGLRRLKSIIGPQGPIPVSRSTWWAGVKSGRFPTPVKLGPRITAWRDADIQRLVDNGIGSSKGQSS